MLMEVYRMSQNRGQGGQESFSERGQKGGEASLHSQNVSASELALYLKGADFPMNKQKLVQLAEQNGAPKNVIQMFEGLPGREFNSPIEVEQAFSREKEKGGGGQGSSQGGGQGGGRSGR